ncbi:hypothetical protein PAPYR_5492 [Paratrimastix pyriformis]|uniref:Uncharacterized protein n=1 Tax=Paratrimastix pyriformis TaxID=342808 RepID=A0ABQ8UHM3_9EUKA|nr:hypothetical protein PAPYR_5492 [Paratrimastix pyriformis]
MPANYIEEQPEITAGPEAVFYWRCFHSEINDLWNDPNKAYVPAAREPDDVQHVISHYLEGLETPPEPKEFAKQLGYILPFLPELGRRPIRGKDGGEAVSRWTHSRVAACLAGVLHKLYPRQQAACYEPVIQRLEALACGQGRRLIPVEELSRDCHYLFFAHIGGKLRVCNVFCLFLGLRLECVKYRRRLDLIA